MLAQRAGAISKRRASKKHPQPVSRKHWKLSAPSHPPFPGEPPYWPTSKSMSASSQYPGPAPATVALPVSAAAEVAESAVELVRAPDPVAPMAPANLVAKSASNRQPLKN